MKKTTVIVFALLLCLSVFSVSAFADDTIYSEGYFYYTITDQSITIVGYFGTEREVTVPSSIAGYPVNTIAEGAFAGTSVEILHLPDTIRSVEEHSTGEAAVQYDDPGMQTPSEPEPTPVDSTPSATTAESGENLGGGKASNEEKMSEEPPDEPRTTPSPTATPEPTEEPAPIEESTPDEEKADASSAPEAESETEPEAGKSGNAAPIVILVLAVCGGAAAVFARRKKADGKGEQS